MSSEDNKAIARRFYAEVWNGGNMDTADELIAGDFVDHAAPPGVASGLAGAKQVFTLYRTAFPDLQLSVDDLIAEGDRVVARWSSSGTHQGELMGIPPTGKQVKITGIDLFRFSGGKLAEHWGVFDQLAMLQQIGAVPSPG
jgi:steroid delta-isomerase-like uncharacterized protein